MGLRGLSRPSAIDTTTLRMALNRAYSSSSSYVLYADQVVDERPPRATAR